MRPIFALVFTAFLPFGALATDAPGDNPRADAPTDAPSEAAAPLRGDDTAVDVGDVAEADASQLSPDTGLLFLNAAEIDVRDFIWKRRIIVVMANTPNDPQFELQIESLGERAEAFLERDVVVIFDTDPEANSPLRQVMRPRGFMTAIIDKDGEVKARRPAPRTGRELMAVIDRFPLRRQEMLESRPAGR